MRLFDLLDWEKGVGTDVVSFWIDTHISDFNMPYMFSVVLCHTILMRRKNILGNTKGLIGFFFGYTHHIPISFSYI